MNKAQAIYSFWSSFGIPAYDQSTIPNADDKADHRPEPPYITYEVIEDSLNTPVALSGSIWYRSTKWEEITLKAEEIAADIGYGHKIIKIDGGYLYITKGTPFAQRMSDEDDSIRRIYINLMVEFLTAF